MNAFDTEALLADPRVIDGMAAQRASRERCIAGGARPIGWKIGFGTLQAMQTLNTAAPLVGFLTDATTVPSGAEFGLAGLRSPVLEPEIAMHIGTAVPAASDRATAEAAIEGLGPAIELADASPPFDDVAAILATNIFHRGVILGAHVAVEPGAGPDLRGRVHDGDVLVARTDDPCSTVGDLIDLTRHVAEVAARSGSPLRPGDVIISGSVVPLIPVTAGHHLRFELAPLGTVAVRLTDGRHDDQERPGCA